MLEMWPVRSANSPTAAPRPHALPSLLDINATPSRSAPGLGRCVRPEFCPTFGQVPDLWVVPHVHVDVASWIPSGERVSGAATHEGLTVGDAARTYRLFRPAGLSERVPLVMVLHGGFGTGEGAAAQTRFDAQAEAAGFLAVYPDGFKRAWNAGRCCGRAARMDVDDVRFLAEVLDDIESRYEIDPRRVYATGISNGGMMAYRLAAELGDRIAAIGPVASALVTECPPGPAVSVIHIHGTNDLNAPYEGGVGPRTRSGLHYPSVQQTLSPWRIRNRCDPHQETSNPSPGVRIDRWRGAADVKLITIEGGGHSWPGGRRMSRLLDPPSDALDATATIWEFFAAHPMRS